MAEDAIKPLLFQPKQASRVRTAHRSHVNGRVESSVTVSYINRCDRAIAITERDGTTHVMQPTGRNPTDELVVCVSRLMARDVMERALEILRNDRAGENVERDQWVRAYESSLYSSKNLTLEASVEYVIYHRDLVDAGGRCYMPDLDLLIEWVSDRGAQHPFSMAQRNKAVLEGVAPGISDETFIMLIKAVDNSPHGLRSDRYINIGGDIYPIVVERDTAYPSGIHIITKVPVVNGVRSIDNIHRSMSFDEADTMFSLHRTVEDAINGGPVESMAKTMVEYLTATKKVEEAKLRTEQLDADEAIQRLRNEGATAKAIQDNEMYSRRMYVEWAKSGAAILGTLVTIYGLWSKYKSSS